MLYYITGNKGKIRVAKKYLEPLGITVEQKELDLIEIQSHDIKAITEHKAEQAYSILKQPLLVNDAGWNIPALNGFPGPYMRYVNEWFTPTDFLNLMRDKEDRRIIFTEYFCFIDNDVKKLFSQEVTGHILTEPKSEDKISSWGLVSLRSDKKSIAQSWAEGVEPVDTYTVWEEFASWYKHHLSLSS